MEGNKKSKGYSSSFTSDLFGSKENSSPSSSALFGSIFPPNNHHNNKEFGRESLRPEKIEKKPAYANQGTNSRSNEGNTEINETSPYYHSSSIYYGGQDVYSHPHTAKPGMINRDEGEDDSGSASRGNWWKGSLYY